MFKLNIKSRGARNIFIRIGIEQVKIERATREIAVILEADDISVHLRQHALDTNTLMLNAAQAELQRLIQSVKLSNLYAIALDA